MGNDGKVLLDDKTDSDNGSADASWRPLFFDFVGFLPDELSLYILRFLTPADVSRAACCCKMWRDITNQDQLW